MLAALLIILIIAADQLFKHLVLALQTLPAQTLPLWQGVLHLTYVENTGAAFGMLRGMRWPLIVITAAACIGMFAYYVLKRKDLTALWRVSLILVTGGALGNLIDRIRLGYVIDYIDFRLIRFAVFNFADSLVVIGGALLIIDLVFFYEKRENAKKAAQSKGEELSDAGG